MSTRLEELFCDIDDFCKDFEPQWHQKMLGNGFAKRQRQRSLSLSEIMTILVAFHQSHYRNFKYFYIDHVRTYWRDTFPKAPSYQRFVEYTRSVLIPLCADLKSCFGTCTGTSFVDSAKISVCHNRRIARHKVFQDLAACGKTSVDWFYGFKLHLVVNEQGELLSIQITPGNVDDRKPIPDLLANLFGQVFADRGYVSGPLAKK